MSETLSCSAIMGGLEQALPSLSGVEFKLLFFISARSRSGQVVERVTAIARAIGVSRRWIRHAFEELLRLGYVSGAIGAATATLPEAAMESEPDSQAKPPEDYVTLWDHLRTYQKTIREPLSDWVVQKCLEIGRAWGANSGREVGSVLYKAYTWMESKRGKHEPPRKWIYILNGLRKQFERHANELQMQKREAKRVEVDRRPADISVRKLAPSEGPAIDVEALAQKKRLQRAVGAS